MLFTKRPQTWSSYFTQPASTNIDVGERTKKRLTFLGINQETLQHVEKASHYILPHVDEMVEVFYESLTEVDYLNQIIYDNTTIERLKITQRKYLEQLLSGKVNREYILSRVVVGQVHSNINLTANYFIMAHSKLIQYMLTILTENLYRKPDELIQLMTAVQKLATFDQQLIVDVYTESTFRTFLFGVSQILDETTQLDASHHLIESMDSQIKESHSVTAATEQMSASIQDVSNHAVRVAEGTSEAVESAEQSQEIIETALNDIERVGHVYNDVLKDVSHLSEQIGSTYDVINVINDIAEQTNLLALNASIEAARAGEHGAGFAVVASEVRNLSEHTKAQIQLITSNMSTLQQVSSEVINNIESTGEHVEKSVSGSKLASEELVEIISTMQQINEETSQIAAMSEEQASTVIEIAERNTSIFDLSTQSQKLAEETAEIIYNLSEQMNNYRLDFIDSNIVFNDQDIIKVGKTDHLLWKWNIYNMLLGLVDLSTEDIGSHKTCRLGEWYYGYLSENLKNDPVFIALEHPHITVHECAKDAIMYYEQGNLESAQTALKQLDEASVELIDLLETLAAKL